MTPANAALRTASALAATAAVAYSSCALFFWLWPEAAIKLTNALFHGLDFRKLQSGSAAFDFGGFLYALIVIVIWAFVLGALFGWLHNSRTAERR